MAIATAMNQSGINIIRMSGEKALDIMDAVYRSPNGKKAISKQSSHTMHYGNVVDGDDVLDEVLVSVMKAPNSYTREDVIEVNCHGGIVVTRRILELLMSQGARLAEPGEFTKRAFLNGRLDLSEAEAVSSLIASKNEFARKNAIKQLKGELSSQVKEIRENVLRNTAYIEAALDDPEHYSLKGFAPELGRRLEGVREALNKLLLDGENGRLLVEGVQTAIVGKPNVGKSSLLNLMLGEEKAIVTSVEGTTRDLIEADLHLDGVVLNLMDTAGIRKTNELVEKMGIEKSLSRMAEADFIILVMDVSTPIDENDVFLLERLRGRRGVVLLNKVDKELAIHEEDIAPHTDAKVIPFSTVSKLGLTELREYVKTEFFKGKLDAHIGFYTTNARHRECLKSALDSVERVLESIDNELPEDFYTIDLMDAYQELGKIIGETVEDDLIDKIFSEFCMGK